MSRHPIAARGPDDERLTVDVAAFGAPRPRRLLVVQCGTHGVEGFAGSAIQRAFLRRRESWHRLAADAGLVLVHAVNPYGFAWWRRANERNVDLNRNFLDWSVPPPRRPDYARLHPLLCPRTIDDESERAFVAEARRLVAEKGLPWVERVLTEGQYEHPEGLYYGGAGPEASNLLVREIYREHAQAASDVLIVDLHTGLGEFGTYTLLSNHPEGSEEHEFLARHFDATRLEVTIGNEDRVTPDKVGLLPRGMALALSPARVRAVTFELGTYAGERVLMAERLENWLHHHGDRQSPRGREIAWEHRECSCPDSADWRERALAHGGAVLEAALRALSRPPEEGL